MSDGLNVPTINICIPFTLYLYSVFFEEWASTVGAMKQHYSLGDLNSVLDPAVQVVSSHLFLAQILFSFSCCFWLPVID